MRKKLTDDFGGLRKNMNCAFPLNILFSYEDEYNRRFINLH